MAEKLLTSEFRVSFPNLFKATIAPGATEAKFSISMLFPRRETLKGKELAEYDRFMTAAKAAAAAVAKEEWGDKIPAKLKSPFLEAGDYEYEGYEPGMVLIRASSKQQPGIVDADVQKIIDSSEIYPGCYGRATLNAFAYDKAGNRGVSFGLMNFQKLNDGDQLGGGRSKAEDDFAPASAASGSSEAADADSIFG